jgi:predicted nuclease of predicted toxin-antitoxin system
MIGFIADENFNRDIVRGLRRRMPALDLITVQEIGISGADDPAVLEWAASNGRVVLSHDVQTLPGFAYQRIKSGRRMPGVVEVPLGLAVGAAIEDILLIAMASDAAEWEGQIVYLPL